MTRELLIAGDSFAVFPYRGRRGRVLGTRELVAISPYVIIYNVGANAVDILRVWHGAQDR